MTTKLEEVRKAFADARDAEIAKAFALVIVAESSDSHSALNRCYAASRRIVKAHDELIARWEKDGL